MNNEPFVIERTYSAPSSRVWDAITSKEKMKQWYFDIAEFKPEVGFEFSFVAEDADCHPYKHLCKIMEVIPGKKLSHTWRYEGFEGDSLVTYEIFEEGANQTRVKLTHTGLETFPANIAAFARSNFAAGWTDIIGKHLKEFVEN